MISRRGFIATGVAAAVAVGAFALGAPGVASAQGAYPTKPITIVVGFRAGGPSDTYARLLADYLSNTLGQAVIVENITGAATMRAGGHVARAEPDGYTLFFNTNTTYTNLLLRDEVPYEIDSFTPIALMHSGAAFVVAPPESELESFEDLVRTARENPGELNFSTTGVGGYVHLTGEYFNLVFGTETVPVAYSGGAAGLEGVMSGEVDFSFIGAAAAVPQIHAGRVKALAVTEPTRVPDLPDVPTVDEAAANLGIDDLGWDTGAWYGLLGPAGLPDEVVQKLNREMVAFINTDEIKQRHAAEGNVPGGDMSPEEFQSFIDKDVATWKQVIEERNVTLQ